jgi:antitoxin VapB
MSSIVTTLFRSNTSQAVRLPKALELPDSIKKVRITAVGNTRIIAPEADSWAAWFDGPAASADFMENRLQPEDQLRDTL